MEGPVTHATICVLHRYDCEPARVESAEWMAVRICTVSGNGYLVSTINYDWKPTNHLQWLRDHTRACPGVTPSELNTPAVSFQAAAGDRLKLVIDEVSGGTPTVDGVVILNPIF